MKKFKLVLLHEDDLRGFAIPKCQEDNHIQQVAFSTYHNCITQICFNCKEIRTTMKEGELR